MFWLILSCLLCQRRQLVKSTFPQDLLHLFMPIKEQRHIETQHRIVHLWHQFLHLLQLLCVPLKRIQKVQLIEVLQLLVRQLVSLVNSLLQSLISQQFPVLSRVYFATYLESQLEVSGLNRQWKLLLGVLHHVQSDWSQSFLNQVWNQVLFVLLNCFFYQLLCCVPILLQYCSFEINLQARRKLNFKYFFLIIEC